MRPILSIVLLVAAVILIVYGLQASDSIASSFSEFFTGSPTDRSMWLLIGGAACAVVGLATLRPGRVVVPRS